MRRRRAPLPALLTKIRSRKQGPFLSEALANRLEQLSTDLANDLDAEHERIKGLKLNDPIRDQLTELFEGKRGAALPQATLEAIYAEGRARYKEKTPPGYMDEKEKQGNDVYGDLVIWKEMIAKAKADNKSLIFITDDSKEDWWWKQDGGTIGPRIELLREFRGETNQASYLYNSETFLQYADKLIAQTVNASAIEEIREVRERDRLLTFEKGYEELDGPVDPDLERAKARLDQFNDEEDFESEDYMKALQEYDQLLATKSANHFTSTFLPTLSESVRAKRAELIESIQGKLAACRKMSSWNARSEDKLPQWLEYVPENMIPYTSLPKLKAINENLREYQNGHVKMFL